MRFLNPDTPQVGMVERLGKYQRMANPGPNFFCCPLEYVAGKVSLRVQQVWCKIS